MFKTKLFKQTTMFNRENEFLSLSGNLVNVRAHFIALCRLHAVNIFKLSTVRQANEFIDLHRRLIVHAVRPTLHR